LTEALLDERGKDMVERALICLAVIAGIGWAAISGGGLGAYMF
jgi:hypothetical protein